MWDPQRVWDQAEEGGEGGLHSHGVGVVEGRIGRNNRLDCIQCDVSKGKAGRETFLLKMGYCKCIARCMLQVHTMSLLHLSSNNDLHSSRRSHPAKHKIKATTLLSFCQV